MYSQTAYLLVFHGSRSRQYPAKVAQLRELFAQESSSLVGAAMLELAEASLAEEIVRFCRSAATHEYRQVKIIPIFLSGGVHVCEYIPQEITEAKARLDCAIEIELVEHLGSSKNLLALVEQKFAQTATEARILLAHGSRIASGNLHTEDIANELEAATAYWKVPPNLDSAVESLVKQNKKSIAIVPYFLFLGKITDAIASHVIQLQRQYPQIQICLTQPLGATPELAKVIAQLAINKSLTLG